MKLYKNGVKPYSFGMSILTPLFKKVTKIFGRYSTLFLKIFKNALKP